MNTNLSSLSSGSNEQEYITRPERTDLLFAQGISAAGSSLLAATLIFSIFWYQNSSMELAVWACLFLLVTGLRFLLVLGYKRRQSAPKHRPLWYRRYLFSSLVVGGSWGLLSFVPTQGESQLIQVLPSLSVAFVAMTAMPFYASRLWAYAAFLGALSVTAMSGIVLTFGQDGYYFVVVFLVLAPILFSSATRFNHRLVETLWLRHEHSLLLDRQQQSNTDLEAANKELKLKQSIIDQESETACQVFQKLTVINEHQLSNVSTWTRGMESFSGDLIQTVKSPDGKQYIFLGDFTGHGLSAALGAIPASGVFLAMASKGLSIESIAGELNEKLYRLLPIGYFCCATLMEINARGNQIRIINAGLPSVIVISITGEVINQVISSHLALGIVDSDSVEFKCVELSMRQDDCYYIYSDGITEAENAAGELWGESGLLSGLQVPLEGESRLSNLEALLTRFVGDTAASDDISILEYRVGKASITNAPKGLEIL